MKKLKSMLCLLMVFCMIMSLATPAYATGSEPGANVIIGTEQPEETGEPVEEETSTEEVQTTRGGSDEINGEPTRGTGSYEMVSHGQILFNNPDFFEAMFNAGAIIRTRWGYAIVKLPQIDMHSIDGKPVYCIEPNKEAAETYQIGSDTDDTFWNTKVDDVSKELILRALYYGYPNYVDNTIGEETHGNSTVNGADAQWAATQAMCFDIAIGWVDADGDSVKHVRKSAYGDQDSIMFLIGWNNIKDAYDGLFERMKDPIPTVGQPNFGTFNMEYNSSSGLFSATKTDSTGNAKYYPFSQLSGNGLTVTQNGNAVTVTATREAAQNLGLYNGYNTPYVKSNTPNVTLDNIRFYYSSQSTKQTMVEFLDTSDAYPQARLNLLAEETEGQAKIKKSSANTTIVSGNSCYSLKDAEYKIYASRADAVADRNALGTLVTKADGTTDPITISIGTYYVKETKAPKGYELDSNVYECTVRVGETTEVAVQDNPKNDPVLIWLIKKDATSGTDGKVSGGMALAGAEYTVKFYGAQYATAAAAEASGEPLRTWVIKTLADGKADISNPDCFVSGSEFYRDSNGGVTFPLGTVVVYESKAPDGYKIDETHYCIQISEGVSGSGVVAYNVPTSSEVPVSGGVKVKKADAETLGETQGNASFANAEFTIYNANGKTITIAGRDYANGAAIKTIIVDGTTGIAQTGAHDLPYGTYTVKETKAPTGYTLNSSWSETITITTDGQVVDLTGPDHVCDEQVIRGGLSVQKIDADLGSGVPSGDASLKDIEFSIINRSQKPVVIEGQTYAVGEVVKKIYTDDNGRASTGLILPYGSYEVKETGVPSNSAYEVNTDYSDIVDITDATIIPADQCPDRVKFIGGIQVQKVDAETGETAPQGDATFAGAIFSIRNASSHSVKVDGTVYGVGAEVKTMEAGQNGIAQSGLILPFGTYTVTEIEGPDGYKLNPDWSETVVIRESRYYKLDGEKACPDQVIRGGLSVQKIDADLGSSSPSGDGSLKNAVFNVINKSEHAVVVYDDDGNEKTVAPGEVVMQIKTNGSGFATTGNNVLPVGKYQVVEVSVPAGSGYAVNTEYSDIVTITNDTVGAAEPCPNKIAYYGGIRVQKVDAETGEPVPQGDAKLKDAAYSITNKSAHAVKVNGTVYEPNQVIMTIPCDEHGVATTNGMILPYGTYLVKEVTAPEGYEPNSEWEQTVVIRESKYYNLDNDKKCDEEVIRGGLSVQKIDASTHEAAPTGDTSLKDIEFSIINSSANAVLVYNEDGSEKLVAPGEVAMIIKTDANGFAKTADNALPYGTYTVKETNVPSGCGYLVNTDYSSVVKITDKQIFAADNCENKIAAFAGVSVQKVDKDTGENKPEGDAKLEGAEFTIKNISEHEVVVNGERYAVGADILMMPTDENGLAKIGTILPYGTYEIRETKASEGFYLNEDWRAIAVVREDGKIYTFNAEAACKESVIRGGVSVQKTDADLGGTTPSGDASLKDVVFNVYNASENAVFVKGSVFEPGALITQIVTDETGFATTGDEVLPYGHYKLTEESTPEGSGFGVNASYEQILFIGEIGIVKADDCPNEIVIHGGVSVQKVDAVTGNPIPQGDASLANAEFSIINMSRNPVKVNDNVYAVGDVVDTFKTDENGYAEYPAILPIGTYKIVEIESPDGYLLNDTWSATAVIREDGKIYAFDGTSVCAEQVIAGGISVQKLDKDTMTNIGPGGILMEGAEFTIINRSEKSVIVNGHEVVPYVGEFDRSNPDAEGIVMRIYTDENAFATTGDHDLPYGTYEIFETGAPAGYMIGTIEHPKEWHKTVEVREDGKIYPLEGDDAVIDELARVDIRFNKEGVKGKTQKFLPFVAFRMTNVETGESHILVTDPNGSFDSAAHPHSQNTNGNDAAVSEDGVVDDSMLDYTCGVWFGGGDVVDTLPDGNRIGAFPVGTYLLEELACEANAGYDLCDPITVILYKRDNFESYFIGTITNTAPEGIGTTLIDKDTRSHQAAASGVVTLIDTITYSGLKEGRTYDIVGVLMDKATGQPLLINGERVENSLSFVPTASNGTIDMTFTFDASGLAGRSVVAFESMYTRGTLLAAHEDIDSVPQTVSFPAIRTTAQSSNGQKEFSVEEPVTLVDIVEYRNLEPGITYKLVGTLMNARTGEPMKDAAGNVITATTIFKPTHNRDGAENVVFEFDGSNLRGETAVVFETLYCGDITLAVHADLTDADQTVTFPYIRTTLVSEDGLHMACPDGLVTLVDTVRYVNLNTDSTYTLTGTLMKRSADGSVDVLRDASGAPVTQEVSFKPETANGTVDVVFSFNASDMDGCEVVAYETLSNRFGEVAKHESINDRDQTVSFPDVKTTASDDAGDKEIYACESVTVVDIVEYSGLVPGRTYIVRGELIDKATGKVMLDNAGEKIVSEVSFEAESSSGSVRLEFVFSGLNLEGKTAVAFEKIYHEDVLLGVHADIDDEDQTVYFPQIRTTAAVNGEKEVYAGEQITLEDEVLYKNLTPGVEYVVDGRLMNKADGTPILDAEGNEIVASTTFTPEEPNGSVKVTFVFDARPIAGMKVVVFETLTAEGKVVADHSDIDDEDQTVSFPKISTTAIDKTTESKIVPSVGETIIVDTVFYSNLILDGRTYAVEGMLMDKDSGEAVINSETNEPYVVSVVFTPEAADGSIDVEFAVKAEDLAGKTMVVFEKLFVKSEEEEVEDKLVAEHSDIEDEDQTVYVPAVRTFAADKFGYKDVEAKGVVTIIDKVTYENLIPGVEYIVKGVIYDKETEKELLADDKPIVAEAKFVASAPNGEVELTFTFDASLLKGKTLVVFEKMYYSETILIAAHEDIEDQDQSIDFPEILTNLTDEEEQHATSSEEMMKLIDRVEYHNLIPGAVYTVTGTLIVKETQKPLKDTDGDIVTVTVEFTADESGSGYVDIVFEFSSRILTGQTLVAFEKLFRDGREVAFHEDLESESQSVHFPEIKTFASSKDGEKLIQADPDAKFVSIYDKVTYSNLVPGLEYTVSGVLRDKSNGSVIKNEDGEAYVFEVKFTPEEPNGDVVVEFVVPLNLVAGKHIVVFENLMLGKKTIASHEDINDTDQEVEVAFDSKVFKYDASTHEPIEGAVFEVRDITEDASGEPVIVVTDANGYFHFAGIPGHEYSIKELSAPSGYLPDRNINFFVTVGADGTLSGDTEIPNVHGGTFIITKSDVVTGEPVPGCEITIYDKDHKEVFKQVTDKQGKIYFYTTTPGVYYYKETATVYGYYLNEDEYSFTVEEDLTISGDVHFFNVPFGTAVIKKVDKAGEPVKGAEISVYTADGKFLGKGISAENGRVYFVSPGPGKYYFVETKAPEGYVLDSNKYYFEIAEDYTITGTLTIVNERKPIEPTKTGDERSAAVWIAIGSVATVIAVGCAVYFIQAKRKKKAITE